MYKTDIVKELNDEHENWNSVSNGIVCLYDHIFTLFIYVAQFTIHFEINLNEINFQWKLCVCVIVPCVLYAYVLNVL